MLGNPADDAARFHGVVAVGETGGRYPLGELIGEGSQALVFAVPEAPSVVKVLRPSFVLARQKEHAALARLLGLGSPYLVRLFDRGELRLDARSPADVFSFAAVASLALTGEPPFAGSEMIIWALVQKGVLRPLRSLEQPTRASSSEPLASPTPLPEKARSSRETGVFGLPFPVDDEDTPS